MAIEYTYCIHHIAKRRRCVCVCRRNNIIISLSFLLANESIMIGWNGLVWYGMIWYGIKAMEGHAIGM